MCWHIYACFEGMAASVEAAAAVAVVIAEAAAIFTAAPDDAWSAKKKKLLRGGLLRKEKPTHSLTPSLVCSPTHHTWLLRARDRL